MNEVIKNLKPKEVYILRNAMLEYVRNHHIYDDDFCNGMIKDLNSVIFETEQKKEQKKQRKELTIEEKILSEKVKLAEGGRPAQVRFFNTAIKKIEEAKTVSYAEFRTNFACETLVGVGFCNRKCKQCKLDESYRNTIRYLLDRGSNLD